MNETMASRRGLLVAAVLTGLYWVWESQAAGNIRVDLLVIYPALLACYLYFLWPRFRFWSLLIAAILMIANFAFFVSSYRIFGKNPG